MTEQQNEIMSDEDAIRYSLETLVDLDDHCTSEEQRAELAHPVDLAKPCIVFNISSFQSSNSIPPVKTISNTFSVGIE